MIAHLFDLDEDDFADAFYAHLEEEREARLDAVRRQLAEMGNGSPLFGALRASYAESDPGFRERMEAMSRE